MVGLVFVVVVIGTVVEAVVPVVVVPLLTVVGLLPLPGTTVGTVEGCSLVFHVAVVGYTVVAMVGTDVP